MVENSSQGKPRIGLIQFPGSNCDADCIDTFQRHFQIPLTLISHTANELPKLDGLILPGGFSYGDYLRGGALASHAKIMTQVKEFAGKGGAVIGICNGFQILTECQLLPGALLRNKNLKFICQTVNLKVAPGATGYHHNLAADITYRMPIAHGEGQFFVSTDEYKKLQDRGQVLFQYCDDDGHVTEAANPNGSVGNIAGIVSEDGRILGMMPHPERATDRLMGGSKQGLEIIRAFLASVM